MRVFELVGPIMFGPSSSHTAGACRLSRAMWQILGQPLRKAKLELHGSFRVGDSGVVNKALVAGLLGFDTDDDRINNSHELMEQSGIDFSFENVSIEGAHNNTVRYTLEGDSFGFKATGASIGGGMIEISDIGGAKVLVTGDYNTLLLFCEDTKKTAGMAEMFGLGNDDWSIETSESHDGSTKLVLFKTSHPVTDEMVSKAASFAGVRHASRHLRFD
ncbi:MAG: L-serine ammonia-lyase, iron-sulfur-dependent, subunit beta [Clostridiaceae bacterium]|nr:L-serine ammonia-lyase, iron-sulfur-dependent, subunit beta [Clostridiaceae bacterium]